MNFDENVSVYTFTLQLFIQSMIFVGALSIRDTLQSTLQLLPIPCSTIWWKWLQTIIHLFIIIIILWFVLKNLIKNKH